jgi:hypothetical protein
MRYRGLFERLRRKLYFTIFDDDDSIGSLIRRRRRSGHGFIGIRYDTTCSIRVMVFSILINVAGEKDSFRAVDTELDHINAIIL